MASTVVCTLTLDNVQVVIQIVNNDIYYAARRNRIHEGPEVTTYPHICLHVRRFHIADNLHHPSFRVFTAQYDFALLMQVSPRKPKGLSGFGKLLLQETSHSDDSTNTPSPESPSSDHGRTHRGVRIYASQRKYGDMLSETSAGCNVTVSINSFL